MYRMCPEHPIIKELLISGEPFIAGGTKQETWAKEASVTEVFELTEPEFADICFQRTKNGCPLGTTTEKNRYTQP